MIDIAVTVIELVVVVGAFLVGKYVWPNVATESVETITTKVNLVITWAEKFVSWAKQFMSTSTGSEKMAAVVEQLQSICEKYGIEMTEAELQAIAQKAYDSMKAGEASATSSTDTTTPSEIVLKVATDAGIIPTTDTTTTTESTEEA